MNSPQLFFKSMASFVFDPDALAYFAAVVTNGGSISAADKLAYNSWFVAMKANGQFSNLGAFQLYIGGDKPTTMTDLANPARLATTNCAFTAYTPYTGNGSSTYIDTKDNPTTNGKWAQNNVQAGILRYDTLTVDSSHAMGALFSNPTTNLACWWFDYSYLDSSGFWINESNPKTGSVTYSKPYLQTSPRWDVITNDGASSFKRFINTGYASAHSGTSQANVNARVFLYAYSLANAPGGYVAGKIGCYWSGTAALDSRIVSAITATLIGKLTSNNYTYTFNKPITFTGDSFNGGVNNASLSQTSAYPRQIVSLLGGNGWFISIMSQDGWYSSDVVSTWSAQNGSNTCTLWNKKVLCVQVGTNDLYANANTPTQVYNNYKSIAASARAQGFKVVIGGVAARDASAGSGGQSAFDTRRASLRTLMQADFVTNIGTNAWTGAAWADGWADINNDPNLSNFNDLTYYQSDKTHLTVAGYNSLAAPFATIIATF